MKNFRTQRKFREWFEHYVVAEILGTLLAVTFAWVVFGKTHSYLIGAGAGFIGEGIGFYGYFISHELITNHQRFRSMPLLKRLGAILASSSTNLIVEFAPAEIIDTIFIRPFLMYYVPKHISPYVVGFVVGKFSADFLFYLFAISGYELKKHIRRRMSRP